jgi:hypothetical protein
VHGHQGGRCVAAATTETGSQRDLFVEKDSDSLALVTPSLETCDGGAVNEIVGSGTQIAPPDLEVHTRILGQLDVEIVHQVEGLEDRPQLVISILPTTYHLQVKIDLGRARDPP